MERNEMIEKFKIVEELYAKLFEALKRVFSENEIAYVSRFVGFGEYGVAFDALTGTFVQENKIPTPEVICLATELLVLMQCDKETYSKFSQFFHLYVDRDKK